MRVLPTQRRGRPPIGAARISDPPSGIGGIAIDGVATPDRAAAGRMLLAFAETPCGRQPGIGRFAAGTAAEHVAQAIGQNRANDAILFATAAAAYARADATVASDVVAPMPVARLSV